jgi:acetylglutamate kinase
MEALTVIKIGGNIIDDEEKLSRFLLDFAGVSGKKILVHGGGKLATRLAEQLDLPQQLVEGRRITDKETLKVITMVYAGAINKNIVARLQAHGSNAIGICGADGNVIKAHRRAPKLLNDKIIDFGFVGDVDKINAPFLKTLLDVGLSVVVAPVTHNGEGSLLNTNADTIAQEIAKSLGQFYSVSLIYSFEKPGVLLNADDDHTLIPKLEMKYYKELKAAGAIFAGMIPKLDNAFEALNNGVGKVIIGKAENLHQLLEGSSGTTISMS